MTGKRCRRQKRRIRHASPRRQKPPEQAQYERYSWHLPWKTRRISAKLPERLVVALNVAARKYRRGREQIIRICLEDWLVEREGYSRR